LELLVGAHRINNGIYDQATCQSIQRDRALWVTRGVHGHGVYAYYADLVPTRFRGDPFVVFEPDRRAGVVDIRDVLTRADPFGYFNGLPFFLIPSSPLTNSLQISILGFVNCPGLSPPVDFDLQFTRA
jgi:hypothetical protein